MVFNSKVYKVTSITNMETALPTISGGASASVDLTNNVNAAWVDPAFQARYLALCALNLSRNKYKSEPKIHMNKYCYASLLLIILLMFLAGIALIIVAGVDPCSLTRCHPMATCRNFPFEGRCSCKEGFTGNGKQYCDECGLTFQTNNVAKIVGGIDAVTHSWPFAARLHVSYKAIVNIKNDSVLVSYGFECGATLINRQTVLTAAHCILTEFPYALDNFNNITNYSLDVTVTPNEYFPTLESMYKIYIGTNAYIESDSNIKPAIVVSVERVTRHELYSDKTLLNDIALLKLSRPVDLNSFVQPACLPTFDKQDSFPYFNSTVYAVGWGLTEEDMEPPKTLQNVKLTVYNDSYCEHVDYEVPKNWESQVCAGEYEGGKDTCQGDSGGSLFSLEDFGGKQRYVSAGITSYGVGCARAYLPGIYTRTSYYNDWILRHSHF